MPGGLAADQPLTGPGPAPFEPCGTGLIAAPQFRSADRTRQSPSLRSGTSRIAGNHLVSRVEVVERSV